jgi:hypothetical protein
MRDHRRGDNHGVERTVVKDGLELVVARALEERAANRSSRCSPRTQIQSTSIPGRERGAGPFLGCQARRVRGALLLREVITTVHHFPSSHAVHAKTMRLTPQARRGPAGAGRDARRPRVERSVALGRGDADRRSAGGRAAGLDAAHLPCGTPRGGRAARSRVSSAYLSATPTSTPAQRLGPDLHKGLVDACDPRPPAQAHGVEVVRDYDRICRASWSAAPSSTRSGRTCSTTATEVRGERATITVMTRRDGDCAEIAIDDGPGL